MSYEDQVLRAVYRKVSVKGGGGVSATVVVTVRQGKVWVSIRSPFTGEAIMEPVKVDELIHTLGLAREDAKKMVTGGGGDRGPAQSVGKTATSGSKAMDRNQVQS